MKVKSLQQALRYLAGFAGLPLHVPWQAPADNGVERDAKVSLQLTNVTVGTALRLVCDEFEPVLDFQVMGGVHREIERLLALLNAHAK